MKYLRLAVLVLAVFLSKTLPAQFIEAQEQEIKLSGWSLSFTPTAAFMNCLKIDIESRFKNETGGVVISPRFYVDGTSSRNNYYDEWYYDYNASYSSMIGFGGDIFYRLYLPLSYPKFGFFIGFGAIYRYHSIEYKMYDWYDISHEGMDALTYGFASKKGAIHRMGGGFESGIYLYPVNKFLLEAFIGSNLVYTIADNEELAYRAGDYNILQMAYSGIVPKVGIKIGYRF